MEIINTVGRRKSAVARIFLKEGSGKIFVNDKDYKEYFPVEQLQYYVELPLKVTDNLNKYDINVNVQGGGIKGQAEALKLGIARALLKINPEYRTVLKEYKLLTRDPREVERKKPGRPKARKRFQFSKR